MLLLLSIMSLQLLMENLAFCIDLACHNLSYYIDDYTSYFTDDTIFYFLEGTHILQNTLEISGVSYIQGLGHIEQGFHEKLCNLPQ